MTTTESNPGWADALQKILKTNKPKRKRTIVLSKAKKYNDIVRKKDSSSLETDAVTKEEEKLETIEGKENLLLTKRKQKQKDNLGIRVKPSITDREHEKLLQKIATKGVVQLFNAVRQQQTQTNQKLLNAGPLERKREQVLKNIDKRAFLDVLMGESKSIPVDKSIECQEEEKRNNEENKEDKVWSVLRDDFVMGAKLKDWDKKQLNDEDSSTPEDIDSDE
ncbi:RRP15-like protein [Vespa crabro]|uniref:RRP15-like protein n=1 Tax=Vespa crabro TaxID=7445 RepID=UPI001F02DBD4|nr:RRP15-like protein [Vespa crabro]